MQQKSDILKESDCENCGKVLHGRMDKRFCNDNCRNEFNRRKKQAELQKANESMPEILKIIKRNYEILRSYGEIGKDFEIFVDKKSLEQKGFNFKFFTSADNSKELYRYCFERGWREVDGIIYIKDVAAQGKV